LPFGYPYSTVGHIFSKDFGRMADTDLITSRNEISRLIPNHAEFPDTYVMDKYGMFTRESITRIAQVEIMYSSPRSFVYYMNRLSGEEWSKEQRSDENGVEPITIDLIEKCVPDESVPWLLSNERGRLDYKRLTDEKVCGIIDGSFVPRFGKASVYQLDDSQKDQIAAFLRNECHVSERQIGRCLYFDGRSK
jgi:hypothetical protein